MSLRQALPLLLLFGLGAVGCGPGLYALPPSHSCPPSSHDDVLRAAPIDVDITPPIGLSLFGHGLEGRIAAGLLTHLRCRGFVFRKDPEALAWVSCDLQSISLALSRRIAELVRDKSDLGADRIIVSATHTHAGPAHFTEGRAYISTIGGSREPSYDQLVVDFIAKKVADGILSANLPRNLEPVEIRSLAAGARFCTSGLNRNRAMPAFLRNDPPPQISPPNPCSSGKAPLDPGHEAVNREITLLRVDKASGGSLGLMAVFAVHPTAISNINDRYHGDLFAFASRYCEDTLKLRGTPGICALANGAEGDVSPDWAYQGELESRRLGERLGAYLVRGFEQLGAQPPDPPALASRYRELILPYAKVEGAPLPTAKRVTCSHLSPYGEIGTPVGGGAPDGPTRLRIFEQLNQGIFLPERADPCNWPRAAVLGVMPENLQDSLDGFYFPVQVPIEWFRIGRQAFVAMPGELTTRAGEQMEAAASCPSPFADGKGVTRTRTVGLTNSYLSYISTSEEYGAQFYEGAETLYGPLSARFFTSQVRDLVCGQDVVKDPDRCAVTRAPRAAESAEPFHREEAGDGRNPNIPSLRKEPVQPDAGKIGKVFMSPTPVRRRWPGEPEPGAACFTKDGERPAPPIDPAKLDAPPEEVCGPFWTCQSRSLAIEVSWKDTPGLTLCGASTATLLASPKRDGAFFIAHAALSPPEKLLPGEFPPQGQGAIAPLPKDGRVALEKASRGQFSALANEAGPIIDDEHSFVQLWFDASADRWHARFRAPEYEDWAGGARYFRFALRDARGRVHITPSIPFDPSNPPPCYVPTEAEIQCDARCAP